MVTQNGRKGCDHLVREVFMHLPEVSNIDLTQDLTEEKNLDGHGTSVGLNAVKCNLTKA